MADHSSIYRRLLEAEPQWLRQICRGVEKESLRVSRHQATLAQTPHPVWIGLGTDPFRYHNGLLGSAARVHYARIELHF